MAYFRELSSLCCFLPFFLLFFLRDERPHKNFSRVVQPHLLQRGEQQWPKHLTEADFRAVLAAAVTVAIEEVAAVTVAAEVVAAEVAGEGKRTRTSGPRARSWGDWCKRYAFVVFVVFVIGRGCALAEKTRLFRKSVSRRRDGVCDALSRSRRLRRARFPFLFFPHRLWSREGFLGLDNSLDMSLRAHPRERYVLINVPSFRHGIHTG